MKDGVIYNLSYHQNRLCRSMVELYPEADKIDLSTELSVLKANASGSYKIRVLYGPSVEKIEVESYLLRSVKSLKVVYHDQIDYHLKFTDRQLLNDLFAQREHCDDIIIVKNGLVTDSFSANLIFFDGKGWFTPKSPLLRGTQRQYLLDRGIIAEREIKENDLASFHKAGLINAMIDFEHMPVIAMKDIYH